MSKDQKTSGFSCFANPTVRDITAGCKVGTDKFSITQSATVAHRDGAHDNGVQYKSGDTRTNLGISHRSQVGSGIFEASAHISPGPASEVGGGFKASSVNGTSFGVNATGSAANFGISQSFGNDRNRTSFDINASTNGSVGAGFTWRF
jgi:hypothetical protein